jgi:hypothetical protein
MLLGFPCKSGNTLAGQFNAQSYIPRWMDPGCWGSPYRHSAASSSPCPSHLIYSLRAFCDLSWTGSEKRMAVCQHAPVTGSSQCCICMHARTCVSCSCVRRCPFLDTAICSWQIYLKIIPLRTFFFMNIQT